MINIKNNIIVISIITLLLSLLFNDSFVQGLKIENVLLNKQQQQSKIYSNGNEICMVDFIILCTIQAPTENCDDTQFTTTFGSATIVAHSSSILSSNDTSRVLSISYSFGIGSISFTFNSNSSSIKTFECKKPDLDNISVKIINTFSYPNVNTFGYGTIIYFELDGLEDDFSFNNITGHCVNVSNGPCTLIPTLQNSKFILKIPYTLASKVSNTIQYNISTSLSTNTIIEIPIVRDSYDLYDIKLYQDSSTQLELFGYDEHPLVSFKVNTTVDKGYPIIENDILVFNTQVLPIGGDESSTSYLAPLKSYKGALLKYSIYYQSSSSTVKAETNIPISALEYQLSPILGLLLFDNKDLLLSSISISQTKTSDYSITSTRCYYNNIAHNSSFPYGYTYSDSSSYIFNISFPIRPQLKSKIILVIPISSTGGFLANVASTLGDLSFVYDDNNSPKVGNIETIKLDNNKYLLRVSIITYYKFGHIEVANRIIGYESLVNGDMYIGVYEFTISPIYSTFTIYDQAGGFTTINKGSLVSINPLQFYNSFYNINNDFDITLIQNVSYLYNDIDVRYYTRYNVLYFNFTDNVSRDTAFTLFPLGSNVLSNPFKIQDYQTGHSQSFTSKWNSNLKLFEIPFFVEANSDSGNYNFILYSPDSLIQLYSQMLNVQLRIKKTLIDYHGPIFKEINKVLPSSKLSSLNLYGIFGWEVKIEDSINGFKYGYVIVKGESDQSIYNISINLNDGKLKDGNKYLNQYDIKLNISYPCKSQDYVISEVLLVDVMGRLSYATQTSVISSYISVFNPFINYIQDSTINRITLECENDLIASVDTTPPVLTSFSVSTLQIDVGSASRTVSFQFQASDPESGIKNNVYPIVYLDDSNNQIIECKSSILEFKDKVVSYQCSIQVPIGFAATNSIYLSVYGFINNNGIASGYNSLGLADLNFTFQISVIYNVGQLLLSGSDEFSSNGGSLILYGCGFDSTSNAIITFGDGSSKLISPSNIYTTTLVIPNVQATSEPFSISIQNSNSNSNTLIITPTLYKYSIGSCNNGINNPLNGECICFNKWTTVDISYPCLVPDHYISTSTQVSSLTGGQITLFGWFGDINNGPILYIDNKYIQVSDMVITSDSITTTIAPGNIGPVQVNYTQNDLLWSGTIYPYLVTEIECPSKCSSNGQCDKTIGKCTCNLGFTGIDCSSPINSNNNNTESQVDNNGTTIIKNQDIGYSISIDSIVELDINNNIVSTFNLANNWILVDRSNSIITFNQSRMNQDQTQSLILLIIQEVNDQDKEFSFAGNQFIVTKGGFKLSISISNWQYQSNLNIIQIQMSSDIKINQLNCNSNNNNVIIESSSNNNHLLNNINYLKVTKNGRVLYARFQDKILADNRPATVLPQLSSSSDNSIKVLLTLPRCNECLIDPDFSLLITQDYQSNCNESTKKWVIAVAVVASVVGVTLLLLAVVLLYKKTTFIKIKIYLIKKSLFNRDK